MVKLDKKDTLFIPIQWIKHINDEDNKFAIFLMNNATMFRFILTKTESVKQFHMILTVLEEDFLQSLFQVFDEINKDFKIKPIYSSGVCFVDEDCYYLFLVENVNKEMENKLKIKLSKLSGVEEIIVKEYNLNL